MDPIDGYIDGPMAKFSEEVRPVSDLRRKAHQVVNHARKSRRPLLITQRGRGAAVLIAVEEWDARESRNELLEAIVRGERDFAGGSVVNEKGARAHPPRWRELIRRIRFARSALRQLEDGLEALDDRAAARRIAGTVERRLRALKKPPRLGRAVPELEVQDLRESIVSPFRIVYRIEPAEIRMLAVVHARRDLPRALPKKRKRR